MNRIAIVTLLVVAAAVAGYLLGRSPGGPAEPGTAAADGGADEVLYWVAPMDPDYRRDAPGKSPMGMDLVPVYAGDRTARADTVSIEPAIAANLGIRTAVAQRGALPRRIDTVGYVGFDETTVQHVHARVDGWIERLSVATEGDPVARGQVLFELYSPALVNAQREFLAALGSRSDGLRAASEERLRALGITAEEIARLTRERKVRERIPYRAERDGVTALLGVRDGAYVTAATPIVSIASLDDVWITAEVFERQAAWVRPGQRAEVAFDSLPGDTRAASTDYVYPELDPRTRTLRVRLSLANADGLLRPHMLARVIIDAGDEAAVVHVPKEAVIRGGRHDRVVLALGGDQFRVVPVRTGIESGDRVAILAGLAEGDRVVTSGQFLIDSEANVESALSRLETPADHAGHDMAGAADGGMDHTGHDMGDAAGESDHTGHDMSGTDDGGVDHTGHDMGGADDGSDHAGHDMRGAGDGGSDHAGHDMGDAADGGTDHAGHDMRGTDDGAADHTGHDMRGAGGGGSDHTGHDTGDADDGSDHAGQDMSDASDGGDHAGHGTRDADDGGDTP